MADEKERVAVEVGQVWESTESRDKGRQVRVLSIDGGYANCGGVNGTRATRLDISRMNARGHWRLVTPTGNEESAGTVPDFSGAAEPFEMAVPDYKRAEDNKLVPVGPSFLIDSAAISLAPGRKPSHDEFSNAAKKLGQVHKASAFWIGDLHNLGESLYSEEASQHADEYGLDEKSVGVYAWVAKRVPETNRRIAPSFSHCQAVAAMKPDQQRKWLEKAVENDWSVQTLKTEINKVGEGRSAMRFLLIVDCVTEPKQKKLAEQLEADGYGVTTRSGLKRVKKAKAKKAKKGEVTAKGRRPSKMNQRRRPPTGGPMVH